MLCVLAIANKISLYLLVYSGLANNSAIACFGLFWFSVVTHHGLNAIITPVPAYLYFVVQDDLAHVLQGDGPLHLKAPFQVEQGDLLGVSGVGGGVDVGQGLEVVVDGVAHHHFAVEQLCHLTGTDTARQVTHKPKNTILKLHNLSRVELQA